MSSTQARLIPSCPKNCLTMFDWLTQTPRFHLQSICSIKSPALIMLQCVGGDGEKESGGERDKGGCKTILLVEAQQKQKSKGQLFCSTCNSTNAHSTWVPVDQLLLTFKGQRTLCLERFQVESQPWCVSTLAFFFFLPASWEKENLKTLSPAWKRGCQED